MNFVNASSGVFFETNVKILRDVCATREAVCHSNRANGGCYVEETQANPAGGRWRPNQLIPGQEPDPGVPQGYKYDLK